MAESAFVASNAASPSVTARSSPPSGPAHPASTTDVPGDVTYPTTVVVAVETIRSHGSSPTMTARSGV